MSNQLPSFLQKKLASVSTQQQQSNTDNTSPNFKVKCEMPYRLNATAKRYGCRWDFEGKFNYYFKANEKYFERHYQPDLEFNKENSSVLLWDIDNQQYFYYEFEVLEDQKAQV